MVKLLMLSVAVFCSMAAQAEEPVDSLQSVLLQNVQITSTRANKKTPVAYSSMNQTQIKSINFGQDIPYLLSLTPSVTMTSDAGNGIGYTSLRVRGTDPSRINITANGIPLNDAESSQVFWVNMGDMISSVQSLQLQRGVGSSTNGAGAFGASLNMLTENIGIKPFLGLDMSAGSYYSHKETLRFGTGLLGGHWGIQGRLSNIGSKGYVDRASTKLNSYFIQGGYFSDNTVVKLITFNGIEETYHAWLYSSKYEQSLYGRSYNPCGYMYKDNEGKRYYYDGQTDNYHQQNYQLIWNQLMNHNWNFNVGLHYTKGHGYYEEYKGGSSLYKYDLDVTNIGAVSDLVRRKQMDNDFYGIVAGINYDDHSRLQATLGGGWNKYDGDHYGNIIWLQKSVDQFYPNHPYYNNNAKKVDGNIYGKINYEFLQGLNAYVDLQYRHTGIDMKGPTDVFESSKSKRIVYNFDETYNFFNPKIGLNYDINSYHKVYVNYAIAHKEPVRNNYENNINANLEKPRAERLNDLEMGYRYSSKIFSAAANFYWMDYKDQFVLTGEIDNIGEGITRNLPKSYRLGIELEAAWQPSDWFRWNVNATLSKNRVKDMTVLLEDGSTIASVNGETRLAFSPDVIANNIFTFLYKGFSASVQTQFVSDQNLTNTGFESMLCHDENGNDTYETLQLKSHCNTNLDLAYNFNLKKYGIKDVTVGVTVYNLFNAKYDNNGWAAPQYRKTDGKLQAVNTWGTRDKDAVGFAVSAPFNMMAHLSINF